MTRMQIWTTAIGLVLTAGLWKADAAVGIYDLNQLKTICVYVFLHDEARGLGLSGEAIGKYVYVWLKGKLPRVQVERFEVPVKRACSFGAPALWVSGNVDAFTLGERKIGYYGKVEISLHRETLWESGKAGRGIAYADGVLIRGPLSELAQNVNKALDALLTTFAAEYYKAGNP